MTWGNLGSQVPGKTVEQAYQENAHDSFEQNHAQNHGFASSHEYLGALAKHVQQHGIANPVSLSPNGQHMVNGHHRYNVARELGYTHLPVNTFQGRKVNDVAGWDK